MQAQIQKLMMELIRAKEKSDLKWCTKQNKKACTSKNALTMSGRKEQQRIVRRIR